MSANKVIIYTDGAATMRQINGKYVREAGGWGFAVLNENEELILSQAGGKEETTNNEMELTAIAAALNWADMEGISGTGIEIHSDSAYCINIFTQWAKSWKNNGWTRGKKHEPIENLELIKTIYDDLMPKHNAKFNEITFVKVKGHAGEKWNEYVDQLAVTAKLRHSN